VIYDDDAHTSSIGGHYDKRFSSRCSHSNDGYPLSSFPAVPRNSFPLIITEEDDDYTDGNTDFLNKHYEFSFINHYGSANKALPSQPIRRSDVVMAPPPHSTNFVSSWT
jgi:hypothetical protein